MYSAVYRCKKCATRRGLRRSYALFAQHCCCPKCGNPEPQRRSKPDRIDKVLAAPLSMVQRLLGGHLYHCVYCRIQFYDLRNVKEPEVGDATSAN